MHGPIDASADTARLAPTNMSFGYMKLHHQRRIHARVLGDLANASCRKAIRGKTFLGRRQDGVARIAAANASIGGEFTTIELASLGLTAPPGESVRLIDAAAWSLLE
ncbi:MAG: hypothetical protein V4693_01525 [Pseudomonadota bacterium]